MLRFLHALFVKHHMLPHEYGQLSWLERKFVYHSVMTQLEDESRKK